MSTVLVFGGSFDPPHHYHTGNVVTTMWLLYGYPTPPIVYIPAARNPLKKDGPRADDVHRSNMLGLALSIPTPQVIWTDELNRAVWQRKQGLPEVPSYTVDTLKRLRIALDAKVSEETKGRSQHWQGELRLLIGSDQVGTFHLWKDFRKVIELAEPLVLVRQPDETVYDIWCSLFLLGKTWTNEERRAWCRRVAPNFPEEVASTKVRDAIANAQGEYATDASTWAKARGAMAPLRMVSTPVADYIIKHKLYGIGTAPKKAPARAKKKARG